MPRIVTRVEWGARPPESINTTPWTNRTTFAVHYSAGHPGQTVRTIQNYHMDTKGWSDIGYNWLVDQAGNVYVGRGWDVIGAHIANHNTECIGVCFIGSDGDITDAAKHSIVWLYDQAGTRGGRLLAHRVHRDFASTECPGNMLAAWVRAGMPIPTEGGVEMPLDEASVNRIWDEPVKVTEYTVPGTGTLTKETVMPARDRLALGHRWAWVAQHYAEKIYSHVVTFVGMIDVVAKGMARIEGRLASLPPYTPEDLVRALVQNPDAINALAIAISERLPAIPSAEEIAIESVNELFSRWERMKEQI